MSRRIDKSWVVFDSIEIGDGTRCVDLFRRPDGSYGTAVTAVEWRDEALGDRSR